jgi:hypothetical protein
LSEGYYAIPTVFADRSNDWRLAREEIFGPVLVAIRWSDEAEAIRMANDSHYGLAAYVLRRLQAERHRPRVLARRRARRLHQRKSVTVTWRCETTASGGWQQRCRRWVTCARSEESVSDCALFVPIGFSVKDGSPHELRDLVLIVQPFGGIEERIIVEMISGVLSHPFKCCFLGCDVFQLRRELDDNRAIIQFLYTMRRAGQEPFAGK